MTFYCRAPKLIHWYAYGVSFFLIGIFIIKFLFFIDWNINVFFIRGFQKDFIKIREYFLT